MPSLNRLLTAITILTLFCLLAPTASQASDHRLGIGIHFWKTLDELADDGFDDIEDDGQAFVLSYRYEPRGLFHFQFDVEYYDSGFGGVDEGSLAPIVFVGVGHGLYAAAGVGVIFADGFSDNTSDPFYAAKVGWEFDLLAGISVDINANYRTDAFDALGNASTDAITLGAVVRFNL